MTTLEISDFDLEDLFSAKFILKEDVIVLREKIRVNWSEEEKYQITIIINDKEAAKMVAPVMDKIMEKIEKIEDEDMKDCYHEAINWNPVDKELKIIEHIGVYFKLK